MSDGLAVPGAHDGMAAFDGENGRVILVRNHEVGVSWLDDGPFGDGFAELTRVDEEPPVRSGAETTGPDWAAQQRLSTTWSHRQPNASS